MIKLSIIMPVYNGLPYIKIAVNSVINQNFKDWELIISDDCSTDGTIEYLKTIKHKKIKIFFQKKNLGIFGGLKFLHKQTKSSIIKILCADDKLIKDSLNNIYKFMNKYNSCKLMTCGDSNYKNIYSNSYLKFKEFAIKKEYSHFIKFSPKSSMLALFAFGNLAGNLSRVTYRKVNDGINPAFVKKLTLGGDYYAWAKYSQCYGFYLVKKKLVYVRDHPMRAGISMNKNFIYHTDLRTVYNFLLKNIDTKHFVLLRTYSLINNFPQRISAYFKLLISGNIKSANQTFKSLPFNVKGYECLLFGILYKFRHNSLNRVNNFYTKKIFSLIKENL
jgi:glycosyltransferase involved in cell wall biosynthesis